MAPWADLLYACDVKWWNHYTEHETFIGLKVTQDARVKLPGVLRVPSRNDPGLSLDPLWINQGSNSGYQAINLAYHLGVSKIALLGFDMQYTDGKSHFHGDHPQGMTNPTGVSKWIPKFDQLAIDAKRVGLEITNCSRQTALECFKRSTIQEWTGQLKREL